MHPLSIFPQLFVFSFFAPLFLRLTVSLFIIYLGRERQKKMWPLSSLLYYASGALVFIGLYTQPAVLVCLLLLGFDFYTNHFKDRKTTPISKETLLMYTMAKVILLSILLTGPGAFAFDLPL